MVEPVAEEGPVRQSGQRVVERLVADLLVEPGILEGHRRLVRHRLGEPETPVVELDLAGRGQLNEPDRLALRDERQHRRDPVADGMQVRNLADVGGGVGDIDDDLLAVGKDAGGLRVVGEGV